MHIIYNYLQVDFCHVWRVLVMSVKHLAIIVRYVYIIHEDVRFVCEIFTISSENSPWLIWQLSHGVIASPLTWHIRLLRCIDLTICNVKLSREIHHVMSCEPEIILPYIVRSVLCHGKHLLCPVWQREFTRDDYILNYCIWCKWRFVSYQVRLFACQYYHARDNNTIHRDMFTMSKFRKPLAMYCNRFTMPRHLLWLLVKTCIQT
jgi:hypothetical protein